MKFFIIAVHIVIGLLLIFAISYNFLRHYNLAYNPDRYYPSEIQGSQAVKDEVQQIKNSLPQSIPNNITGIILGLSSIIGAVAFGRNKRWAAFVLPLITLLMFLGVFYTGAVFLTYLFLPFALAVFLVLEVGYITRHRTQFLQKPF